MCHILWIKSIQRRLKYLGAKIHGKIYELINKINNNDQFKVQCLHITHKEEIELIPRHHRVTSLITPLLTGVLFMSMLDTH